MPKETLGTAMLTLASFIWGTALVAQSVGMEHVGPLLFNALRFLIGGIVLLPVMYGMRRYSSEGTRRTEYDAGTLLRGGFYCGSILFVTATFQQIGIAYTTVGKAGFITALYIVIVPVLGVFLGKKVPWLIWGCIALAMLGMYLLCVNGALTLGLGDTLVLLCACSTAAHILCIDYFSPRTDGVRLSCLQFFVCALLSGISAFLFETVDPSALLRAAVPILYTGILSCGVAYTLQTLGQKHVNPIIASLLLSLESVFAVLSGWVALGETLSMREVWGCVLIFIAILAAQLPELLGRRNIA